ncbi:condensation domain-containing protein [Bacillus mobilis]|nr:condensation domain-containing protein [Bacillus mobilis]
MVGELCIAGDGVARGYLNNSELTEEKFIPNPYGEGMMYRSGDLARWLPDGNIEYVGRIDEQIKLRGFRIELGEIESVIRRITSVKDAVLLVSEQEGEKSIYAYLVADRELDIGVIHEELAQQLPAYMIPTYMMQIERIPVTRNGKLDKAALPKIEMNSTTKYTAPRNQTEEELISIFEQVLGIEKLGITDGFYELGGDSIKAIRVVSKLREANYSVSMREVIQLQTVESIAKVIRRTSEKAELSQKEISGEVPLTPIQSTFFKWQLANPNHFNQSMMLVALEGFDEEAVKQSLLAIVKHHDILRAIFTNGKQEIFSMDHSEKFELNIFDFHELKDDKLLQEVENRNNKLQRSMNLVTGPLMKCALFKTSYGDHLMISIHHLVVDGVSWRIILEDFESGYKQYTETKKIEFPKKTTSYQEWSKVLLEYQDSIDLQNELGYWNRIVQNAEFGQIPADVDGTDDEIGKLCFELDVQKTKQLLRSSKIYKAELQDVLLAALGRANQLWQGREKLTLLLEGHGREELNKDLQIDRTVGWFTTIYPITLECADTIEKSIAKTKEILKGIPKCGIGYGILQQSERYEIPSIEIDISFNFLGELNQGKSRFSKSTFSTGTQIADQNIINNLILNGIINDGKFKMDIFYNTGRYSELLIKRLKKYYEQALQEMIDYSSHLVENSESENKVYEKQKFAQSDLRVVTSNIFALKPYDIFNFKKTLLCRELLEYEKNIQGRTSEYFEPFAYQKFFLHNYPDNICGAKTEIQGNITQEQLVKIVRDIVCEQSVFRISYDKDRNYLEQYDYILDWHIPYIDISSSNHLEQNLEWCDAVIQVSQLFNGHRLLSKVFIVKVSPDQYFIYFFVHHGLWDLASTEILDELIKGKLFGNQKCVALNHYTEYTKVRNALESKNQLQADAKDFADEFFNQVSDYDALMEGKTPQRCLHVKYKLNEVILNKVLEDPILWVTQLYAELNMRPYVQFEPKFPFLLMHFGRKDMGFHTVGLHLDVIPYRYDGSKRSVMLFGRNRELKNYGHLLFESNNHTFEQRSKYFKNIPVVNFYADMETENIFDNFNEYELELKDIAGGNEITLRIFKDILYVAIPVVSDDTDCVFKIATEYIGLKEN